MEACGCWQSETSLVSLMCRLSFLLRAPELLRETYSKTATTQSRTHPINMTRTWCYFPTQTFKISGTDISHGAPCGSLHSSQDVHAAPPAAPPQQEVWGRWAAEAEAGAEEVAGGALHPTLVTSCFEPRQTQRLLVPPGPAPGCP